MVDTNNTWCYIFFIAPSGISPPTLLSETPTSILITWSPPQYPNGVLQGYEIERRLLGSSTITTVTIVGASAQRVFVDQSAAITPYSTYEYRVIAKSSAGSTPSDWAQITTKQARKYSTNLDYVQCALMD